MRILVTDDDDDIRTFLKTALEAAGYAVDTALDGEQGSYLARTNDYDLVLLDNSLPKKMGVLVCKEIRQANKHMPIIMISVQSEIPEKIILLNEGADDYITKPFSFDELLARIQASLRRPAIQNSNIFKAGEITLNTASQEVTRAGKKVYLTRKEFSLLEYLFKHKGSLVTRGMILEHVWDIDGDPFSNTIEAHIRNIRKKIDSKRRPILKNIPGRGYMIDLHN